MLKLKFQINDELLAIRAISQQNSLVWRWPNFLLKLQKKYGEVFNTVIKENLKVLDLFTEPRNRRLIYYLAKGNVKVKKLKDFGINNQKKN